MVTRREAEALAYARDNDRELWWAMSDALKAKYAPKRRCGDCHKWMKSRECPRENNVKGISRGPSCNDFTCYQFAAKTNR